MKQACIFDLDGTLLSTEASIAHVVNGALAALGLAAQPVENYRYYAGDGIEETLRRALADAGDAKCRLFDAGIPICRARYAEDPLFCVRPYVHIPELLDALRARGVQLAVYSNKPHAQAIAVVEHFFGKDCFATILGQLAGRPKKPDPAGVFEILHLLDCKKEACLYLGDTDTDMRTGTAAGLVTIGASWGFRTKKELADNGADHIIDDPLELLALL